MNLFPIICFSRDTYLKQNDGELINDYNDRCIRKACSWFMDHLPKEKFVFLTDDANNRSLALEENIQALTSKCLGLI